STLMQRSFFAPVLSATLTTDSCWIILAHPPRRRGRPLLRLANDADDAPPLLPAQRSGFHNAHYIANPARVFLVMGMELFRPPHRAPVQRVPLERLDGLDHRLVHLVRYDGPYPCF